MLLDLDFKFQQIDGTEIDSKISDYVSKQLAEIKTDFDAIDAMDFALSLRKTGKVEMKASDIDILETFIRTLPLEPIFLAPILRAIKSAKEKKISKK